MEFRHFSLAPNDTTLAAIAAEAAGAQERQWQYLDTFFRNQDVARASGVDEEFLREVAEAVPELDPDQWAERLRRSREPGPGPRRCDAGGGAQAARRAGGGRLGARRASASSTDRPSTAEIEAAIDQVSSSD